VVFAGVMGAPMLLVLALALSAVGDYFLSRDEGKFTIGLLAFLAAHLLYIALFWQMSSAGAPGWGQAAMAAYALGYGGYLWPRVGEYRLPVLAYIFVITTMVSVALLLPAGFGLVLAGSLLFAFSDSILALDMFVITNRQTKAALGKLVWVSYVAAQAAIVIGLDWM